MKNKIIVVYSSHLSEEENTKFNEHVTRTIGVKHDIHCYPNFNERSLSEIYNEAIDKFSDENVIMVFCHNDIIFETKDWGKKLLAHFNNNDYQIIGVAGTTYIPKSGRWWEDKTKMVGQVKHQNEIQEWLSAYSNEYFGVREVVTIDGLFMAVDTTDITHKFDEDYGKFHFYDISFCFPNYLDGCNIGVVTNIKIKHLSVGETNDEWEVNRFAFSCQYDDDLPIKHVSTLNKIKVCIGCLSYGNLTGSELYVYEIARGLVQLGCDVTIIANSVGEPLATMSNKERINVRTIGTAPNYRVSNNNLDFFQNEKDFDILHLNHKPVAEYLLKMYPNTPAVMHIHSEIIPNLEEPVLDENIKKYFSIRPSVTEYIKSFGVDEKDIVTVVNPIDTDRFNTDYEFTPNEKPVVLYIGTLDYLRKEMLFDMIRYVKQNNMKLQLIGHNNGDYLNVLLTQFGDIVEYLGVQKNVEEYIKKADYTVGIMLGRTTLEGFFCGKKGWIYDVDKEGKIISKKLHDIPENINDYSKNAVINKIYSEYKNILNIDD